MKNEIPIFVIDFEGSKQLGIVEFALVGISEGEIFALETSICAPREKISGKETMFFGITNEQASQTPPFETHANLFCGLRLSGIFAAHSCGAEDSLIRSHMPSPGRVTNFFSGTESLNWGPWIDSRKLAKIIKSDLESEKLSDAISELGLLDELNSCAEALCPSKRRKWHCAPYDALASALIIKHALLLIDGMGELARINGQSCGDLF